MPTVVTEGVGGHRSGCYVLTRPLHNKPRFSGVCCAGALVEKRHRVMTFLH